MSFYGDMAQTATDLLKEFGASALLRRNAAAGATPVYDPTTGATTPGAAPVNEKITACVFDINEKLIDGSLIQRGDKTAYVSVANALGAPRDTDVFVWLGDVYTIINHKELAPAGVNVLFEWQVRK